MNDSCVVVFTARGMTRLINEGGSQAWVLNSKRAKRCKYLVCVQNRDPADYQNDDWGDVSDPHKNAFFIGKVSDIVESTEREGDHPKRWLVKVSEYAHIAYPDMWDGARNPVAYSSLTELGIDEKDIIFNKMPIIEKEISDVGTEEEGITIQQAKKLLAKKYEVSVENIEIIIRA